MSTLTDVSLTLLSLLLTIILGNINFNEYPICSNKYRYDPLHCLLVQWCINLTHALIDELRYPYEWLELMVHHTPTKARARNVSVFSHPCWSIHGVMCGEYRCDPLAWLHVQWCINPTHAPIGELRGMSTHVWIFGAHGTLHITQGRG